MPTALLVDDDEDIRGVIRDALVEFADFEVIEAADGASGLRAARTRPDVILLDLTLPDLDGYEVLRRLRAAAATADLPVLAVTGAGTPEDRHHLLDAGFDGCIAKPFDLDQLLEQVRSLVAKAEGRPGAPADG